MKGNKSKIITIIIAVVLVIVIVPSSIYCIAKKESPAQMITDMFTSTDKQILGKWQGDTGVSAYEFYEDGSYDSYLSTFSFSGNYTIDGNKLTLTNPATAGHVVYKITVTEKKLIMILESENGTEVAKDDQTKLEFDKVAHISTKSINDLINDVADAQTEKE